MGDEGIFDDEENTGVKTEDKTIDEEEEDDVITKPSKRTQMAIGGGIFVGIGVLIVLALTGVIDVIDVVESEPFDGSQCQFGVHSDFFGERCITLEEFEAMQGEEEKPEPKPVEQPSSGNGDTKDVSSASDKVEIEKTNEPIGYYIITTEGDWYGDYVDFRKVPSKIEENGNMKVSFRCYTDNFAGTSTYFGTFRNVIADDLTVEVYINGIEVQIKSTDKNRALILEGSCYGHES